MANQLHTKKTAAPSALRGKHSMVHREYYDKLCHIMYNAKQMSSPELDDEQLHSLSVRVLDELNVDEPHPIDFAPRFFDPQLEDAVREYYGHVSKYAERHWYRPCRGEDENGFPTPHLRCDTPGCDAYNEAVCRNLWMTKVMRYGMMDSTGWCHQVPRRDDFDPCLRCTKTHRSDARFFYRSMETTDSHCKCINIDTHVTEGGVLLSEVVAACHYIKDQLRYGQYLDHHTFPILIVSLMHDSAARITQAHFDGHYLYFRPSRILDLATEKPTRDALLILMWIASFPMGETTYVEVATGEGEQEAVAPSDKAGINTVHVSS